jgi:hypothetical protein
LPSQKSLKNIKPEVDSSVWRLYSPLSRLPTALVIASSTRTTALTQAFEYDVAFSFNAMDEGIATQLNDLLAPRMKTFIYSERQREIAGTDGQESFSKVYGKTARIVVILYRPEWGETPWTRIERDAIKNRSLDEGWDFTTFVPTVEQPQMPPWLPKTRLYIGLQRWGVQGAASVIEARVAERGGSPHEETVAERADRFARTTALKQLQEQFQRSDIGVKAARGAYEEFSSAIEEQAKLIAAAGIALNVGRSGDYRIIHGPDPCNATCYFRTLYSNSLEDIYLHVEIYKGFPEIPGYIPSIRKAAKLRSRRYAFRLLRADHNAWIGIDENARELETKQLADHVLRSYMDVAERTKAD